MIAWLSKLAITPEGVLFGLLLGVLGLIIGVAGFAFTLKQIKQVKSVAEAQKDAISNLRFRLSQLDVVQECAKAERALDELRACLINQDTEITLASFDSLALSLVCILEGAHSLTPEIEARLKSAINDVNKMSESSSRTGLSRSASAKQAATFREYHGMLVKIRALVQEEQQA